MVQRNAHHANLCPKCQRIIGQVSGWMFCMDCGKIIHKDSLDRHDDECKHSCSIEMKYSDPSPRFGF